MKKIFLVILLSITFISGCSNEVNNFDTSEFNYTYINTSELSINSKKALEKNYGQFKIDNNIQINSPDEINMITFKYIDNYEENYMDIFKLFFSQNEINSQKINLTTDQTGSKSYDFWNETNKMYGCVGDNGFIAILKPELFDISFAYNEPNIKIYHVDRGDDLSDVYKLKNGNCSIENAVKYINSWFETNYKKKFPYYNYKVKTVIVREHENNYLFEVSIEIFYKEIPLDSLTMETEIDEDNQTIKMKYVSNRIDIQMTNKDEIGSFTNGTGMLEPIEEIKIDECISLESALEFCKYKFTNFKNISISDIGIKYMTSPDYDYKGNQSADAAGNIVNSRPVWEFIIDVKSSEFLEKGDINTYGDVRKYIYIDMISGELFYQFDTVLQGIG